MLYKVELEHYPQGSYSCTEDFEWDKTEEKFTAEEWFNNLTPPLDKMGGCDWENLTIKVSFYARDDSDPAFEEPIATSEYHTYLE